MVLEVVGVVEAVVGVAEAVLVLVAVKERSTRLGRDTANGSGAVVVIVMVVVRWCGLDGGSMMVMEVVVVMRRVKC